MPSLLFSSRLLPVFALTLVACAPARTVSGPATPAPAATPSPTPTPAPQFTGDVPPMNWHLLDETADGLPGISSERAMRELLAGVQPKRSVVVAVIDGGTDTSHADLRANLWANAREVGGNRADDDNNGYADDLRGWNYIGGRDGRDVHHDTYELTRIHAACTGGAAAASAGITKPAEDRCRAVAEDFERERDEAVRTLGQVKSIDSVLTQVERILRGAIGPDSVTPTRVRAIVSGLPDVQRARAIYLQLAAQDITRKDIDGALKGYQSRLDYGLNTTYDPRPIVGDSPANLSERLYGNAGVMGPDAEHGTHVAGIIGAVRGNSLGIDGIAPAVKLMVVRTVPDGDERDKDVANAIRYAVDNGANVINMSFGKAYSSQKRAVDEAAKYADSRGVLLVHAAGNDGEDNSKKPSFPTPVFEGGGRAQNWIEVGASSWKGGDALAAPFSNYAQDLVDVFAPGVDIYSTIPGGGYERESGTSMAAPVVSGLAALIMAYYPNLTAADVKRIILASSNRKPTQMVVRPGDDTRVPFGTLSSTGGIVNAYAALKMAKEMSEK